MAAPRSRHVPSAVHNYRCRTISRSGKAHNVLWHVGDVLLNLCSRFPARSTIGSFPADEGTERDW